MDTSKPIIICGSGNSIPFLNSRYNSNGFKHGLEPKLEDIIKHNYSIGLNYWFRYGCETTFNTSGDYQFYLENSRKLEKEPLLIVAHDPQLKNAKVDRTHENTIVLKHSGKYNGKDAWQKGFYSRQLIGIWALSLAIQLGFKEIYLLGYDCCELNTRTHFYQGIVDLSIHTKYYLKGQLKCKKFRFSGVGKNKKEEYKTSTYNSPDLINRKWYKPFLVEKKINIYNVSIDSAITLFPKITYLDFYSKIGNNNINQQEARQNIKDFISKQLS